MTTTTRPAATTAIRRVMRSTPILPIPYRIDDDWVGISAAYEEAWHWEFGTVFLRKDRIDISFWKEKCEVNGLDRDSYRAEFMAEYPGGVEIYDEHHDEAFVRYYFNYFVP